MRWLRHHGCPWNRYTFDSTVEAGNVKVIQYLYENNCPYDTDIVANAAGRNPNLDVLKWLRECGFPWSPQLCSVAASWGRFDILKWAIDNGCPVDDKICASAAGGVERSQLKILKWLRERGYPWHIFTCKYAAMHGYMDVVKWARENGCPWDAGTCAGAASHGNLANLQWLREQGCDWDDWTCCEAARLGNLEVLVWAHENGCPWDEYTFRCAVQEGPLEVYEYLKKAGCPYNLEDYKLGERKKARGWDSANEPEHQINFEEDVLDGLDFDDGQEA